MWPKELIDRKSAVDIVCNLELKMLRVLNETYKGSDIICVLGAVGWMPLPPKEVKQ